MAECKSRVAEEISASLDRAGFETPSSGSFRIEVTDTFQRKLGECRPVQESVGDQDDIRYQIRIARRLFEDDRDSDWRDVVRHEVAHAYVFSTVGRDAKPHGEEWKEAARRAGASPTARYEGEDLVDPEYILACPNGCSERGYLKRSKRIKFPWKYACPNGCFEIGYVQHREETRRPEQYGCGECESQTISYPADQRPTDPTPGTNYTDRRND